MLNSGIYLQKAPVLFGNGTIQMAGEKSKEIGISNAMIISDDGVDAAGHVDTLKQVLDDAEIPYIVWAKAKTDCPDYTVLEAAAIAREVNVNGVIGLGGGSVMDTAKAVAAVAANDDQVMHELPLYISYQKFLQNAPLSILEIPTTSGTGSENTFVAVIDSADCDCKIGLPVDANYCIIDPELTITVSPYITAFTGMDALSHAMESLTHSNNTAHSDLMAYEAIRLVHDYLPRAVEDGSDLEARGYLSYAADLAGISFSESGIHIGHSMAHMWGHLYELDHGACCAIMTPAVILFSAKDYPEKLKRLGTIFGVEFEDDDTPEKIGDKTAIAVRDFGRKLGIRTFEELGLSKEDVMRVSQQVFEDPLSQGYARKFSLAEIEEVLSDAYDYWLNV